VSKGETGGECSRNPLQKAPLHKETQNINTSLSLIKTVNHPFLIFLQHSHITPAQGPWFQQF